MRRGEKYLTMILWTRLGRVLLLHLLLEYLEWSLVGPTAMGIMERMHVYRKPK